MQLRAVGVFAADGHVEQFGPEAFALGLEFGKFGLGQFAHVGVRPLDHLHRVADLGVEILEAAILLGQLAQRAVLSRRGGQPRGIGQAPRDRRVAVPALRSG